MRANLNEYMTEAPEALPWIDERPAAGVANPESNEVFKELHHVLARAVASICPPWLQELRDDLVQASLIKVLEIQRRGGGDRQYSTAYLWKVAYSSLIDEIRRFEGRRETPLDEELFRSQPGTDPNPEREFASKKLGEGIRDCLGCLIEARRMAVTLYLQGHTVPDAAKILGWTSKKTENLVYRGLSDLRICLRERGFEP